MIYLDNNATTPVKAEVLKAMLPYFGELCVNASSPAAAHAGADRPRRDAAAALTRLLHAEDGNCFTFTSGATESNNWVFGQIASSLHKGTIIVSAIEHASVSEPAEALIKRGFKLQVVKVDSTGTVALDRLEDLLNPEVVLVSIIAANNETGVIQPLRDIGRLVRELAPSSLFHTDATQAVRKMAIDLSQDWAEVDLLSFSAHKFHGPKGLGGLYARPGLDLPPLLLGGGQEGGRRSGTLNTPALAGLAAACELAAAAEMQPVAALRDRFESDLIESFPSAIVHAKGAARLPNTSCFSIPGFVADEAADALASRGIAIGTGSACSSGTLQPPKSLLAMGVDYDLARAALRLSLSTDNTLAEISELLAQLTKIKAGNSLFTARSPHRASAPL